MGWTKLQVSHESGQLAARIWWINCSLGQVCILVTGIFLFPGHPTLHLRCLWEILLECVNSQSFIFNEIPKVSFSTTCIFAPKRKEWPPELIVSGMLEADPSDSRDHPALLGNFLLPGCSKGLHPAWLHLSAHSWNQADLAMGVDRRFLSPGQPHGRLWSQTTGLQSWPPVNSDPGAVNCLLWAPIPDEGWELTQMLWPLDSGHGLIRELRPCFHWYQASGLTPPKQDENQGREDFFLIGSQVF